MNIPPTKLIKRPQLDTPPFVPRGTLSNDVIKYGSDLESIPSSDAHVSPLQHANADITAMPVTGHKLVIKVAKAIIENY